MQNLQRTIRRPGCLSPPRASSVGRADEQQQGQRDRRRGLQEEEGVGVACDGRLPIAFGGKVSQLLGGFHAPGSRSLREHRTNKPLSSAIRKPARGQSGFNHASPPITA